MKTIKLKNIDIARAVFFHLYEDENKGVDRFLIYESLPLLAFAIVVGEKYKFTGTRMDIFLYGIFNSLGCQFKPSDGSSTQVLYLQEESEIPVEKWESISKYLPK